MNSEADLFIQHDEPIFLFLCEYYGLSDDSNQWVLPCIEATISFVSSDPMSGGIMSGIQ